MRSRVTACNDFCFRTQVNRVMHPETGKPAIKFQHPTLAGPGNFGGWFEEKVRRHALHDDYMMVT